MTIGSSSTNHNSPLTRVLLHLLLFLQLASRACAVKEIRFVSPLQSLTIPDPEHLLETKRSSSTESKSESGALGALETPRRRFLPRFLAGLKAENSAREQLATGQIKIDTDDEDLDLSGDDWASKAGTVQKQRRAKETALIEKNYDAAMARYDAKSASKGSPAAKAQNPNKYQFVGIINRNNPEKPISWHARPKPKNAKWSVRLVHVNKDAIVKDLFDRGKIDIFAKYTNTGKFKSKGGDDETKQEATTIPIVSRTYEARERSLKNLFNFSPKHFFTDSSGAYWRERRLPSGLYTDGESMYETSYRYRDGRNGMHKVSTLKQYLSSKSISRKDKESILKKLKESPPDIVLEL